MFYGQSDLVLRATTLANLGLILFNFKQKSLNKRIRTRIIEVEVKQTDHYSIIVDQKKQPLKQSQISKLLEILIVALSLCTYACANISMIFKWAIPNLIFFIKI